jgi:protease-4
VFPRQATAGKVAVVTANGNIKPSGEDGIVPTRTVPQLRALANDPTVRAVVVRVNSGGGDVGSSEALGDAVAKLRSAGKKVVASMGSVAASGGYMFACPAHKLFAQGGTLTGSIGVLAGKPAAGVLAERLGVHVHSFADHPAASLTSFTRPWEGRALDFMLRYSHNSYRFFVDFVARHRERDVEAVERVAGGQVWTGRQAKELGLVDELGGLHEAVEEAKRLAGGGDLAVVYDARRGGRDFGAIAGTPFALASAALSSLFAPRLLAQRESSVAEAFESLARRPVLEEAVWGFLRRGLGREVTQLERDAASARVELRVQPELSEGVRRL